MADRPQELGLDESEQKDFQAAVAQSRRGFLGKAAILGGAAFAASGAGIFTQLASAGKSSAKSDIAILNFALKLEYLESTFYDKARSGAFGRLNSGLQNFAETLYAHEIQHVQAIQATIPNLGGRAISKPGLKFPALTPKTFLRTSIALEQTGVGAYGGAFPMLTLTPVKQAALSIHSVEARHAAYARRLAGITPAPIAFYKDLTVAEVLARAKPFFA